MMMNHKVYQILLAVILWPLWVRAETLLATTVTPTPGYNFSIVNAYQVGDEIWVTSQTEQYGMGGPVVIQVVDFLTDEVTVDLPTITAKHIGTVDRSGHIPGELLFHRREQVASFDFSKGDGWVDTRVMGWIHIRSYPWVYHDRLGWLYVREDSVVSAHNDAGLSYFFYSSTFGWLWKSPLSPEIYSFTSASFVSINDLAAVD